MPIMTQLEVHDLKQRMIEEANQHCDDLMSRPLTKENIKEKAIDSELSKLQTTILLQKREMEDVKKRLMEYEKEKQQDNMNSQEKFLDASNKIYKKTPEIVEQDTYITNETDNLLKTFYGCHDYDREF